MLLEERDAVPLALVRSDRVEHGDPVAVEASMDDLHERTVIPPAYVLEHADRDDCIEGPTHFAVVLETKVDGQALALCDVAAEALLLLRDRHADHVTSVFLR